MPRTKSLQETDLITQFLTSPLETEIEPDIK